MSVRAMAWAWEQATMSSGERLVLLALADHAGDDGECWPQTPRLADKCALDKKTVQRHLIALDERGVIVKMYRRKRSDGRLAGWQYRLALDDSEGTPVYPREGTPMSPPEGTPTSPREGTPVYSLEPSRNHQLEPSREPSGDGFDAWWQDYPRKTSKPTAVKAWKKLTAADRVAATELLADHIAYWERERTPKHVIPHPATWLNGRRWEDELPQQQSATKSAPGMDMVRRLLEEARNNGQE